MGRKGEGPAEETARVDGRGSSSSNGRTSFVGRIGKSRESRWACNSLATAGFSTGATH